MTMILVAMTMFCVAESSLLFTEHCYRSLILEMNWLDLSCMKLLLAKLIGYAIIVGAAIVKLPQILKILSAKSVFGVSFLSVSLQLITNILTMAYSIYRGNPFSTYGETILIAGQMFIIMLLFSRYGNGSKIVFWSVMGIMGGLVCAAFHPQLFPSVILENCIVVQMVLLCASRLNQIIHVHQCGSTGSLALATCVLTVLGNIGRIFTVLVEASDDWKYQVSFFLATALNGYILFLFWKFGAKNKSK